MPRHSRPATLLLSALALLVPLRAQDATPLPATPAVTAAPPPEEIISTLVLRNASVDMVLDLYERWSGRILLRPPTLPAATFTLNLDKPLPKSEVLRALETLLNRNGIGLAPLGERFTLVSSLNLIRADAPELIDGSTLGLPPSGRIAAKIFKLSFLRVTEFSPQIAPMLSPAIATPPAIFEKTNSFLVVESVANLQRIEHLITELDRPASGSLAVKSYDLKYAKASDLANKLRTLLAGPLAAQIGSATTYQPDDRTNQLLLISDPREQPFFDSLVARLDTRADPTTRSEVIFLKHADAVKVEALLAKLVSGQNSAAQSSGAGATRAPAKTRNDNPSIPIPPTSAVPEAAAALVNGAAASEEFSSLLTIVSDERSNAIVVAGTPDDIRLVVSLVNRLDVLLAQVRIEVVIAEVTLNDNASSGVDALGLRVENNKLTGFSASGPGASIGGIGAAGASGASGATGFAQSTGYGQNLTAAIGLSTTPRKDRSSILSVPTIVTTHNKEAEIFVGETRPVISGTQSTPSGASGGNFNTSSTVTQQKIGIRLKVLPLIGSSGTVQLKIDQQVEDVLGTVKIDGNDQPRIGSRTTTSFVSAANGEIIVLGGLQRNTESKSSSRLGPIPFLGDLFGSRSRAKGRTELIFFLRPIVLTNTALDNIEALKRIDDTPQAKKVREVLDHRPASLPPLPEPAAAPAPKS
ncbi:MAG: type II secretory pathway, component PulD [Verrucomicrobia bacterium]|nr:type II secretory pathway, component PulD [Verrucomicrobiota bacterium]